VDVLVIRAEGLVERQQLARRLSARRVVQRDPSPPGERKVAAALAGRRLKVIT